MDYINKILCGNDLEILPQLPAESVSCMTTSPPYWGLRDYGIESVIWDEDKNCKHIWGNKIIIKSYGNVGTHPNVGSQKIDAMKGSENKGQFCQKCGAWKGSLGLEPTFELYIKHLCDIFDEVKRVLRKDGCIFVNLGDTYNSHSAKSKNVGGFEGKQMRNNQAYSDSKIAPKKVGVPDKSLCDIPYRFSIEMINRGWIKRNTIIWHKPNCMPSSAPDRFTVDFEYLFFFTKNNKTLFWTNEKTLECVSKKPPGTKGVKGKDWRWGLNSKGKPKRISFWTGHDYWFEQQFEETTAKVIEPRMLREEKRRTYNGKYPNAGVIRSMNRNKRSVWTIPTQPFPEAHFAVYPEGLIEIPIKAGCPEFICKKCGKARVRILEPTEEYKKYLGQENLEEHHAGQETKTKFKVKTNAEYKFRGYSDCGCGAGWESGIVCDPFMGAGTSALVALKQRKRFIGIEIKQEYIDMSYKRISKVQQRIF